MKLGVVIPLLVLGLAIFNTFFTIFTRIRAGEIKNIGDLFTYAGKDHFHHRLHYFGLPNKAVVIMIFLITICLGLGAIVLRNARKIDAILILAQSIIVFVLLGFFLSFVERRYIKEQKYLKTE